MPQKYKHYREFPASKWRWPNFSPREMASKREGELMIDEPSMDRLQRLRDAVGRPLVITSAYRSAAHNRAVGGASGSLHMQAKAFDVSMSNHDPHQFEAAARALGFTGFGYYPKQGFMHIDTGPARTWGTPFPRTASGLAREPVIPAEGIKAPEGAAAAGAAAAGGLAFGVEHVPALTGLLGALAPTAQLVAVGIGLALLAFIILRKRK